MDITKSILREVGVTTDILCDSCGKSCRPIGEQPYAEAWQAEYMTLTAAWGFYSNHDGETWKAHLCEECVVTKLGFIKFNIKHSF